MGGLVLLGVLDGGADGVCLLDLGLEGRDPVVTLGNGSGLEGVLVTTLSEVELGWAILGDVGDLGLGMC